MKKHILLLFLLLTSAAIGQDRGLLPVVPNLSNVSGALNADTLKSPWGFKFGNGYLLGYANSFELATPTKGYGKIWLTGGNDNGFHFYTGTAWDTPFSSGASAYALNMYYGMGRDGYRIDSAGFAHRHLSSGRSVMTFMTSRVANRVNIGGGINADTLNITETVTAKTVVVDSAAVKILVYDSTKAVRDSLVWIVKSIDLPIGPYANAARMGSVTFRLIVPGTGVRDFGIVGDTANGVMLSYAAATVTGTYAPNAPFQVWQQVGLYWYTEYFPNAPAGHTHLNKVRADLSKWNNAPAIRRYVFDGSGAYYSEWEIVVNYVMATPASASTWYVKIID